MKETIERKLNDHFAPEHLEVLNESGNHNVPPGSESHFRVVIVASAFDGQPLLARHRAVHETLADELAGGVHALALHTLSTPEWNERDDIPASPPCLGGGRSA